MKFLDISPKMAAILWLLGNLTLTSLAEVGGKKEGQLQSFPAKVINGTNAGEFEFPFFLRLTNDKAKGKSYCGATIISKYFALTAAHCLVRETGKNTGLFVPVTTEGLVLRAGSAQGPPEPEYTYDRKVLGYKVHPLYNRSLSKENDIAVLEVEVPFLLDEVFSAAIKLDLESKAMAAFSNGTALIMGWGYIGGEASNETSPSQLQKASVLLRPHKYCETEFPTGLPKFDRETMICSGGGFHSMSGGCRGDSGGPLIFHKMQIGVISYGDPMCRLYKPSAYTRVSAFAGWLRDNTDINY